MEYQSASRNFRLAFYCSGHGYGHATRVSALARHLLGLDSNPEVYLVSTAPEHVFADSISRGAQYRHAYVDPVIVQPVAYHVDRQKSIEVLRSFLDQKDEFLEREVAWLKSTNVDCVLSDSAFLGCLAANAAMVPCILVTNFTFDSVYSYLSTSYVNRTLPIDSVTWESSGEDSNITADVPIPYDDIKALVDELHAGYRCADLLVLLPGAIPIPSFSRYPPLPAHRWTDESDNSLLHTAVVHLDKGPEHGGLLPAVPFPSPPGAQKSIEKPLPRSVIQAPLLVRTPTNVASGESVYTPAGRSAFLASLGVPKHLHDPSTTHILVVSFGGQRIRRPNSGATTPIRGLRATSSNTLSNGRSGSTLLSPGALLPHTSDSRLATTSQLLMPGAPPAFKPECSPLLSSGSFPDQLSTVDETVTEDLPRLLPDESWIAIVCGVSKEQWAEGEDELPEGFYVAPKYVYMPDLTAVADVILGKLGYGTVSECVDSQTPFVYVSRPLFVEEHGLRRLLEQSGVGHELSRTAFECGDWAHAVERAWKRGKLAKDAIRAKGGNRGRDEECRQLAVKLVDWITAWKEAVRYQ